MRYAGIIRNDFTAAPGVSVSFFTQGCPHRCFKCHNPETWNFDGGQEFNQDVIDEVIKALTANGVTRSLSIMGGEPLCPENAFLTYLLITEVKKVLPNTKVYIWTGYTLEKLLEMGNDKVMGCLHEADVLIDGPYKDELRDITLKMRGSSNQRILDLREQGL